MSTPALFSWKPSGLSSISGSSSQSWSNGNGNNANSTTLKPFHAPHDLLKPVKSHRPASIIPFIHTQKRATRYPREPTWHPGPVLTISFLTIPTFLFWRNLALTPRYIPKIPNLLLNFSHRTWLVFLIMSSTDRSAFVSTSTYRGRLFAT
jgi:hypothetical protein